MANLGYSPSLSARVLFEGAISFHRRYPSAISEFNFVVYRNSDEKPFQEEYERLIILPSQQNIPTATRCGRRNFSFKVEVIKGSIADEHSDIIVNSTSTEMRGDANQISKAIFAAGGGGLKNACSMLAKGGKNLNDGKVISTPSYGKLKCKEVYHVHVLGKAKRDQPPTAVEATLLKKVIHECLSMADNSKHETVSFPSFCLGVGNYTVEQSGSLMFEALEEFMKSSQHLKNVHIVIYDPKLHDEFQKYFNEHFVLGTVDSGPNAGMMLPSSASRGQLTSTFIQLPQNPVFTNSISFKIYGIQKETLTMVEKRIKMLINSLIVTDMVDLGEIAKLIQESDLNEVYELANKTGVKIDVQYGLERVVVNGEEGAVKTLCNMIQFKKTELSLLVGELKFYEWYAEGSSNDDILPYPPEVMMQLEVAFKRNHSHVQVNIDGMPFTIDLVNKEEIDKTGDLKRKVIRRQKIKAGKIIL